MRQSFLNHIRTSNIDGSNKAESYIRAIDKLGAIIGSNHPVLGGCLDIWRVDSEDKLHELYEFTKAQQQMGEAGLFKGTDSPSYWRNGFYSSAVKAYAQFVALRHREYQMLTAFESTSDGAFLTSKLVSIEFNCEPLFLDDMIAVSSREGRDVIGLVKSRQNQDVFRKMILDIYNGSCCVTGLTVPEVLRSSHIIPWAENSETRMNPENGLCLSATYDAAFDKHLISFDEDYRMILAPSLDEYCENRAFQESFKKKKGCKMALPSKFFPSQEFLANHREHLK